MKLDFPAKQKVRCFYFFEGLNRFMLLSTPTLGVYLATSGEEHTKAYLLITSFPKFSNKSVGTTSGLHGTCLKQLKLGTPILS